MKASEVPYMILGDRKWHWIGGWAIRYNPNAKAFPFTAWRYRGKRVGVKAKSLAELKRKIKERGG